MNSCVSPEVLSQLLGGAISDEQVTTLREHLVGCPECRELLDNLSENPELPQWASAFRCLPQQPADEPELVRLLGKLAATPPARPYHTGETFGPVDGPLAFLAPPQQEGDLGRLGPYRVLAELGRGGMGVVLLAYDQELQRTVALKVVPPDRADARARARFVREAQAAAGIEHDHVVPVYTVASSPDAPPYLVMQYVQGPTLRERIKGGGRLDPHEAARVCAQAAKGLAAAHRTGLVHRDIKPANIILDRAQGRAKIVDFGLARDTALPAGITQAGTILGTPEYMSPEQVQEPDRVDGRTDVYGLGVTLYEALTGEVPFRGLTHQVLQQVVSDDPRPPCRLNDKVPRDLETICLKCLEKQPGKRYARAQDLADDLERFLAGKPIRARPVGRAKRLWRWCRRNRAVASLVAALFLVLAAGLAGATSQWLRAEAKAAAEAQSREAADKAKEQLETNLYYNRIALAHLELLARNAGRAEELLDECPKRLRGWEWRCLKRLCRTDPVTIPIGERPPMGEGFDLAFSPDNRLLAVPSGDRTIKVWDAAKGQEVLTLRGHANQVLCVAFSPDGKHLASTSEDKTVRLWDLTTGKETVTFLGHANPAGGLVFSPNDGRYLASVSAGEFVRVWDTSNGSLVRSFPAAHVRQGLVTVVFSPDGSRLASGSGENAVKVWEVTSGREALTLSGHTAPVFSVAFSADGKRLASLDRDSEGKLWDLPAGPQAEPAVLSPRCSFHRHSNSAWSMAFSPDGRRLAVGGGQADANVRVYDTTTGETVFTLPGHIERVISVAFSPDGQRLASASLDRTIKLWEMTTGQEALTLRGHSDLVGRIRFSPDGHRLASASADGTVRVWDANPLEENPDSRARTLRGHAGIVYGVAFSPDGKRLASASADGTVKVWNPESGQEVRTLRGHADTVFSVAFGPDGRLLSGSRDRTARLWNVETGQAVRVLDQFQPMVRSVALSPDGKKLATSSVEVVQLWDTETGGPLLQPLRLPDIGVRCVTFSPDGRFLATAGGHRNTKVWDAATGKEVSGIEGHATRVWSVAFSSNGDTLASGDADGNVTVWERATGQTIRVLGGHSSYITGIAFSRDGRYLATASWGEVIVWDAKTYGKIKMLGGHAGTLWGVAFSPDGKRLAAASGYKGRGEIKIWDRSLWDKTK
jgi:WD40 repeat protein